jgi:hypothetical protein
MDDIDININNTTRSRVDIDINITNTTREHA